MATIPEAFATAFKHQQAGSFESADQICRQILAVDPDHVDTLHLLGLATFRLGKHEDAVAHFQRAISLRGDDAALHSNLGAVFQAQRKLAEAEACFRRVLERTPDYAIAHSNLGVVLRAQGKLDEAVACFNRALQLQPDYAVAHCNLGAALRSQGKLDEAAASLQRALELKPDYAEAHNNLAAVLKEQGKLDEAVARGRRALALKPDDATAHSNLGAILQTQRKPSEAEVCFRRALALQPELAEAHNSLGVAFKDQGRLPEAIASFRKAIELRPGFMAAHSNLLYTLHFCPDYDAAAIYEAHRLWNRQCAAHLAPLIASHANNANPERRLRVGYVSPNFRVHAQAFFLAPLFSAHDHQQFEIFAYSDVVSPDGITSKLRSCTEVWRVTTGISDEEVAQWVRRDQIDILVDLTLHLGNGRPLLFARKPAPVQVCWLAYQGTTGLSTMDYRLTDSHLDPPGLFDAFYSEESVRLPDSFWCYDPLAQGPTVNALPLLEKGYVTFGSLNNACKVTDDVLRLWARVLRALGGSRLMVLADEGPHRERILELFGEEGITRERIEFKPFLLRQDYLALYHQIDIGLDTFPYNGQTTTLDSVWMGVPVVTLMGHTSTARAGASLLRNLGISELVAESPDRFVTIAVELAENAARLRELRASLRGRLEKSPLMDAPRFAKSVETAYRTMWLRWCATRENSTRKSAATGQGAP